MTNDDIVTRLRGCWCGDGFANRGLVDPACDHDGVRAEAADEIERLRTELQKAFAEMDELQIECDDWKYLAKANAHP